MSPSKKKTAPAKASDSPEAELRELINRFAPKDEKLVGTVRLWIRKRLPTSHELVYEYRDCFVISFSPSEHGYEGVFVIRAGVEGVRFYFNRGRDLSDPGKLLKGSGGQTRWIALESVSTLTRPEVARLIDEALARNPVPFASTGGGTMIIRPTTAKRRRSPSRSKAGARTGKRSS